MMPPSGSFLEILKAEADGAAAAEKNFRREAAEKIAVLDVKRAFAFRRLNLMRAVAAAVETAQSEDIAVANGLAVLRAKLGWTSDSEARSEVLSQFSSVARAVFAMRTPLDDEAAVPDVAEALARFETWFLLSRQTAFWVLFEHHVPETPVVDF